MNIKKLRTKLGLTQTELANYLGCRQESISKWENGNCPSYINRLAELALKGVSIF